MYRIKEVLSEKGMSAKQLADAMGVTPQYISGIIRETGSASVEVLAKIAGCLGVPISSLFDDYGQTFVCPHCGKEIRIKLEKGE